MKREEEKAAGSARLWAGGARDKDRQLEEKVVALPMAGTPHNRDYKAFEIRANVSRLHIHRATQPSRFPNYNYLLDIVYDHDFQSLFTLIYSFMAVEVKGHNLGPVVHAISSGSCESIHEFHRKHYDPPSQEDPVIEEITITAADEK